ncbi:hypothetical protein NDU88_002867 [Pleurodeles waltl]|uniref:Uncharacterized protein n=1 Tax=Pleurodeles waltl TaxID=8319 RepID=A0AAV7UZ25_PLEWA|nr:hypothetical protein NDU88_002867 [Pleurodeles waltl]
MDTKISKLATEERSICTVIAGFQDRVTGMEHRHLLIEDKLSVALDRDQELQYLRNKLMDLEDRSHRDSVRFFSVPE